MSLSNVLKLGSRELFLLGARLSFGFWLLYLGIGKVLGGPSNFIAYLLTTFEKTWAPPQLITGLGWVILAGEVLLGLALLSGKKSRCVWFLTAVLMFTLTFGQTMIQQWPSVANNWQYFFLALACAALSDPE